MIASTPLTASLNPPGSVRSLTRTKSRRSAYRGRARSISSTLCCERAVPRTRRPRRSSSSTMCAPMYPVAPVTRTYSLQARSARHAQIAPEFASTHIFAIPSASDRISRLQTCRKQRLRLSHFYTTMKLQTRGFPAASPRKRVSWFGRANLRLTEKKMLPGIRVPAAPHSVTRPPRTFTPRLISMISVSSVPEAFQYYARNLKVRAGRQILVVRTVYH